ncbi:MAG: response regulator [Candidatus Hydrothermarchaeales archaeon]
MGKVMIVDDEPDVRYIVKKMLKEEGYGVVEAESGADCLEKIKRERPDLVLLDIMMPGMDGWEVLEEIQNDKDLKSTSVTMFTIKPVTPETLQRKGLEGLVDYIVKPFSKEGFLDSVKKIFGTISEIDYVKKQLESVSDDLALEYEKIVRAERLHQNLLTMVQNVLIQRKEDGSMDDIQSFEDVIRSESKLIESYKERRREIEGMVKMPG